MKQIYLKLSVLLLFVMVGLKGFAEDVTYTVTSTSAVSTSGTAPSGSSATFANTYTTKEQLISGKKMTLTLSGYAGMKITGITLSMKSNKSAGAGYLSVTAGSTTLTSIGSSSSGVAFNNASWNGEYTTSYTNVTPTMNDDSYIVKDGEELVVVIGATVNSLYCQSFKISYENENLKRLNTPQDLACSNVSNSSVYLSWGNVDNSEKYRVEYKDVKVDEWKEIYTEISNCTISGLEEDSEYEWKVTAVPASNSLVYKNSESVDGLNFTTRKFEAVVGVYNIVLNNPFWHASYPGSFNIEAHGLELHGTKYGISFILKNGGNTNGYVNDYQTRVYDGYSLQIDAPEGFYINKVQFTADGSNWDGKHTATVGTMADNKNWGGVAGSVTIFFKGTCRINNIAVTYAKATGESSITISPACTDGNSCYSTYSTSSAWIVPNDLVVSEIGVNNGKLNVQNYETGAVVPANTGVMVSAVEGGSYKIYTVNETGTSVLGDANCLRPSGDDGITVDGMGGADAYCMYYRLTMHNGTQIGYWWGAEEGAAFALAANKAYLAVPKDAGVKSNFWFGGETAISAPVVKMENEMIYNLNGQRVSSATKGLYIRNGKKYLVK